MGKRIGIFGGSFNPIHIGHLVIAEAAWQEYSLSTVIFVPTGDTPGKDMHRINKYERYTMTEMAISGNPHFTISPVEIKREGLSYTVDTIRYFREQLDTDDELYFIAGTDAVADLPTWKYNKELLESCYFICARRPGHVARLKQAVAFFGNLGKQKIYFLKTPELAISSTILRDWIESGRSVRYFIPDAVRAYISEKRLYKDLSHEA
ncbi:MAG: nicotinate-nucleotide adenylyltransferase [Dialister sp.]|nr:nicotinate-nucleotide adenylyltransferase [Dialister sp.]